MKYDYKELQTVLMDALRLYHYPIAINYIFDDAQLKQFTAKADYYEPVKNMTFCQWELVARMKGQTVLATKEQLGCSNALVSFGWKEIDANEVKSQVKYCKDLAQAERFLRSKPVLKAGLKAVAVSPLKDAVLDPDVVHFYCDNMQSYHLAIDWMAATNIHPLRANITMSSSACGGGVYTYNEKHANILPACSGSYNAGKTERGEVNVLIPGEHIGLTVERLQERIAATGSSAITRPGDPFPGADICKNCPLIVFKKGDPATACEGCPKK